MTSAKKTNKLLAVVFITYQLFALIFSFENAKADKPVVVKNSNVKTDAKEQSNRLYEELTRKNFAVIEEFFNSEITQKNLTAGGWVYGSAVLTFLFEQNARANMFDGKLAASLDEWVNKNPKSSVAHTLRGCFLNELAWKNRGGSWASQIEEKRWQEFQENASQAKRSLETALLIEPKNFLPYVALISVARALDDSAASLKYFTDAKALFPFSLNIFYERMSSLAPWWGGNASEFLNFARTAAKDHKGTGAPYLLIQAHYELCSRSKDKRSCLNDVSVWLEMESAAAVLTHTFPSYSLYSTTFAKYAEEAEKMDVAEKYRARATETATAKQ